MTDFLLFLLTLVVAAGGGLLALKLKIPAGAMVGSMIFVVAFNLITEKGFFYGDLRTVLQIFGGVMIGSKVGKEDLLALKKILWPTVVLVVGMVILNLLFGTLIATFSELDVATSLFATTPGGVSDMALISEELGANTGYVAILQVFRLLIIFSFCPPIFKKIMNKNYRHLSKQAIEEMDAEKERKKENASFEWKHFALLFLCAAVVGVLFWQIGVTAGAMIGAMLGGAAFTIFTHKVPFPRKMQIGMQICSGAFIGIQMKKENLAHIDVLLIPILIMIVGILVFVFLTSFVMHKLTKLDYPTCMFASTPGGLQEMSLLSEEMGADTLKVAVMQTMRLVFVISFFPTLNKIIVGILG